MTDVLGTFKLKQYMYIWTANSFKNITHKKNSSKIIHEVHRKKIKVTQLLTFFSACSLDINPVAHLALPKSNIIVSTQA